MSLLPFLRKRECGENKHQKTVQRLLESRAAEPALNQPCQLLGNARSTFLMDFSADRRKIASTHGDHSVRVTDISTGKCTHVLKGHPRTPWCLAFHPSSNQILASGCLGGEVRIWDLLGGGSEVFCPPCKGVIASMAFHPSDHVLVFATSNRLYFWDWCKPEPFICCKTKEECERIRWVRFCPLGHNLYTGIANGSTIQRSDVSNLSHTSDQPTDSRYDSRQRRLQQRYRTLLSQFNAYQSTSRAPDNSRQAAMGVVPVLRTESSQDEHDMMAMRPPSPAHEETFDLLQAAQALRSSRAYAATVTQDARRTMLFERHGLNRPIPHGPELQARLRSSRENVNVSQLPSRGTISPPPRRQDLPSTSRGLTRDTAFTTNIEPVSHADVLSLSDTARDISSIQRPLFVNTSDFNRDRSHYLLGSDTSLAGAWGNSFRESLSSPISTHPTSSHSIRERSNLESSLVDVWSNAVRQSVPSPAGSIPSPRVASLNSPTASFRHSPSGLGSRAQASSPGGTSILRTRLNAAPDNIVTAFSNTNAASNNSPKAPPVVIFGREESAWTPQSSAVSSHIHLPSAGPIVTQCPTASASGNLNSSGGPSDIQVSCVDPQGTRVPSGELYGNQSSSKASSHSRTPTNNNLNTDFTSSAKNFCSTTSHAGPYPVAQPKKTTLAECFSTSNTSTVSSVAASSSKDDQNCGSENDSSKDDPVDRGSLPSMNSSRDIVGIEASCVSANSGLPTNFENISSNLSSSNVSKSVPQKCCTPKSTVYGSSTNADSTDISSLIDSSDNRNEVISSSIVPMDVEADSTTPTDSLNSANLNNDRTGDETQSDNSSSLSRTSRLESSETQGSTSGIEENAENLDSVTRAVLDSVSRALCSFSNSSGILGNSRTSIADTSVSAATISSSTASTSDYSSTASSIALTSDCFPRTLGLMPITSSSVASTSNCISRTSASASRSSESVPTTSICISASSGTPVSVTSTSGSFSRTPPDLSILGFRRIPSEALLSTSVLPVVSTTNNDLGLGLSDIQDLPLQGPSGGSSSRFNCDNSYQSTENVGALPDTASLNDNSEAQSAPENPLQQPLTDLPVVDSNDEHARIRNMTSRLAQEINVLGRMIAMRERFSVRLQAIQHERNEAMANNGSTGQTSPPTVARIPDITITQYQGESTAVPSTSAQSGSSTSNPQQRSPARDVFYRGSPPRQSPPEPPVDDLQAPPESALQGLDRTWRTLQRRHLHPHYGVSILDETINRPNDALQAAINRAIAGAFMGTGEAAVASNIINLTHRIQCWDFTKCLIPDISNASCNIVVPYCKIHNDASCDISQDSTYLATFVPSHRGFPDDIILAVFSLLPSNRGDCLFTKSFGPNAISVSLSPLKTHLVVGLASRRLSWVYTASQVVGQVYKLSEAKAGESSMEATADIPHSCDLDMQPNISVNSVRWLPEVGEGIAYGTNKGDLHICRPGANIVLEKEDSEAGIIQAEDISNNNNNNSMNNSRRRHDLMQIRRINAEIQTLMHSSRRTAATQTDQPAQSQQSAAQAGASTSRSEGSGNENIVDHNRNNTDESRNDNEHTHETENDDENRNVEESMTD